MTKGQGGYTLIELMIVVLIIGILAAVLVPMAGSAIARTKDATTLGNLAILRGALAAYYGITEGKYPTFSAAVLASSTSTGGYDVDLQNALVPTYIDKIPVANLAGNHHPSTNQVCESWNMLSSCEDAGSGYGAGWMYDANPSDVNVYPNSTWGQIRIACDHTNIRGRSWSTY